MPAIDDEIHECDAALTLAFSVLGKRWNGMIISTLGPGPSSFVALRRAVAGISDTVLSDRLVELAQAGLVARTVDAGPPVAVSYALTPSGESLLPILEQLGTWASANLSAPAN
ncbi:winged helix-turn-helix transcriptional regulator [Ruania halotolerans]|uniref:winged helix-turn-helix transcriptional regulator n=1 Tax=Ruania halotolerans TaxID=2897773 RepID=UPI001E4F3573|nr:helix-turn-helix domain-containing protein [Ruania halotolerans]UFU06403.1 helix-turn-helix transcriptional regulator [Ruania halotolerans]